MINSRQGTSVKSSLSRCLLVPISVIFASVSVASSQSNGNAGAASDDQAAQYAEMGQQALATGQYVVAQQNFEKLAKLEPAIAEVHATLAVIDFKLRAYEDAVREIHTAQKLKPGLPKLDSLLGASQAELGRFKEALPGLDKGFKQSSDVEIRRMCGLQLLRAYTGLDRNSDAVETALALNKFYPDDPEVLYNTSRIYGNYTYLMMEKLRDRAPDSVWMLQASGEAHESEKDYEAALQSFDHVLKLEPRRPGVHYRMGRVYLRRFQDTHDAKDQGLAADQFRAELEIDPQNGNALYELAQLDHDGGRLDDSRKEFEALVTARPSFEQARVGLAAVLVEANEAKLAVTQLQRAVELEPNDEVAWYRLSQALRATGDGDGQRKALATFRQVHASETNRRVRAGEQLPDGAVTPQQLGAAETQDATQP
jgi:predicted Zn-dependent protease